MKNNQDLVVCDHDGDGVFTPANFGTKKAWASSATERDTRPVLEDEPSLIERFASVSTAELINHIQRTDIAGHECADAVPRSLPLDVFSERLYACGKPHEADAPYFDELTRRRYCDANLLLYETGNGPDRNWHRWRICTAADLALLCKYAPSAASAALSCAKEQKG
jgi:hypothetical protein